MRVVVCVAALPILCCSLWAQNAAPAGDSANAQNDISGMYSFLREGEFLQVTVEDGGNVTGFISRYGDSESDRGAFLNQFFKSGHLDGAKLTFTTETVHAVWFDFKGNVERGAGKSPGDEAYHVLRGTLTENRSDQDKKVSHKSSEVTLKSFPQDLESKPATRD